MIGTFLQPYYSMLSDYIKALPQYLLPKQALNRFAQFMANLRIPWIKNYLIQNFVKDYQVDMSEALQSDPRQYASFNDFFIRQLKPGSRIITNTDVVSPVDGSISEIGYLTDGRLLQAKGRYYSLMALLASNEIPYSDFQQGCFATLYLSPKDYHRVHMPIDGVLQETIYVPGTLFSVKPKTAAVIPNLFARNERLVTLFSTSLGPMVMVLVGAAIVGRIGTVWGGDVPRSSVIQRTVYANKQKPGITIAKGSEMGHFKLGSTVIVLFSDRHAMQWLTHFAAGTPIQLGQGLGSVSH
jgi:phosphatidylserine decarboxylase